MNMAEQDSKPEEALEATEAAPKSSPKKFILIGLVLLLLGGGGFAGWKFLWAGKASEKDDQAAVKTGEALEDVDTSPEIIHQMDPFIDNLLGDRGKRYLKAKLDLEVESEEVKSELKKRTPQLRDAILLLLTSKTFEDVSRPEGKIQLRNELIARINQLLQGGTVRTLYFTEFVVQ
jgi:flagellar FliL protein